MKWQEFHTALGPAYKALKADIEAGNSPAGFESFRERAMLAKYSLANLMLIFTQRPAATYCAGYQEWRKLGRQVQAGERGITIWAPIFIRGRKAEVDDDSAPELRYRLVTVFDISQTAPVGSEVAAPELAGVAL